MILFEKQQQIPPFDFAQGRLFGDDNSKGKDNKQGQKQPQIPFGDDNKKDKSKSKDNSKGKSNSKGDGY